ncbi:uncharacterized protein LOC133186107 [Saccostrea echinata]|uniref:uncharacterized protein LOC133186107 n=1 Tax=Saccostrea echinata TaxID=191078 RepID=UPI002A7FBD10|nr:uncharacterized protein LOC133186107 [Saccostrea echinata]
MAVWVTTTGSHIPEGAVRGGFEADGRPLFIARAQIEGIMTPGKCGFHLPGAQIPFGMIEQIIYLYDVLVHPTRSPGFFDWRRASEGKVPSNAYKTDKDTYIGRAFYQGSLVPGKIATGYPHWCAYIGHGGNEISITDYEVLCELK